MPYRVRISQVGGATNWAFQYMLALALREGIGDCAIHGAKLPDWGIETPPVPPGRQSFAMAVNGHAFPMPLAMWLATEVRDLDIDINYVALRMAYFRQHLGLYRRVFVPRQPYRDGYDERHLVIHVRGGDVLDGVHPNYFPQPLSWYAALIEQSGLRPVFVGQLGDAIYAPALRAAFPTAEFVGHDDAMADFHILRTSAHVVTAISTFSWLAAWLSERAQSVTVPVAGMFHPLARPEIDMLPVGDLRYRFAVSTRHRWRGTAEEVSELLSGPHGYADASHGALARLFDGVIGGFGHAPPGAGSRAS